MTDTPLDRAHAAMEADPANDAARLRFYERLADSELHLLLDAEPEGDRARPLVFELESGPTVLLFDREARMAAFLDAPAPYLTLSGRALVTMLAGQGMALGLNLGVAPSSILLPADAVDWLAATLPDAGEALALRPARFLPPGTLPEAILTALDTKLANMSAVASAAWLVQAEYEDGTRQHLLALVDVPEGAQDGISSAVAEALRFSGVEAGSLDVTFLRRDDPLMDPLGRTGLRFDLPELHMPKAAPLAPGMDPSKPPKLT
ncbi:SseB family protein [Oceanomicrobium pacificus]|uniref:SseB family protein n=1 Tax=Oceanomicrobium pacificus TaxID=2692916 RepID=A0A6B0TTT8_9RHOB|nr:SseB family protein [Oceanomicrobium pacificus]MXU64652.1 SseB family protein [Oceanomicrobium pacificus]